MFVCFDKVLGDLWKLFSSIVALLAGSRSRLTQSNDFGEAWLVEIQASNLVLQCFSLNTNEEGG